MSTDANTSPRQARYARVLAQELAGLRSAGINDTRARQLVAEALRRLRAEEHNLDRSGQLNVSDRILRNAIDEVRRGL